MALHPGMQDLSLLPEDRSEQPTGASNNGVQDSTADFGRQAVEAIVDEVEKRVAAFLQNPAQHQGHGAPM